MNLGDCRGINNDLRRNKTIKHRSQCLCSCYLRSKANKIRYNKIKKINKRSKASVDHIWNLITLNRLLQRLTCLCFTHRHLGAGPFPVLTMLPN